MNLERVHRLRLLLRDLAAAAAFGSMAISGQLPLWVSGLFGGAALAAVAGWRALQRSATAAAVVLMALGGFLALQVASGRVDLVIAACSFAGLLCAHRLLSEPSGGTDAQVHLSSLLMISGGAALSSELFYALLLIAFAGFASFSLGFSVVAQHAPEAEPFPARLVSRQLTRGALISLGLAVALFVLFPRLSWNFATRRAAQGLGAASSGFSDRVQLGGTGSIKTNPRLVLRARLDPDPGVESLGAYWVGRTYEAFDGREWRGGASGDPARRRVTLGPSGAGMVRQEIELLPAYGSSTLIGLETPMLFGDAVAFEGPLRNRVGLVRLGEQEVRMDLRATAYTYHAYSVPGRAAPETLAAGRYLQLPEGIDPRVGQLARQLAGGERDPLRAAQKLRDHLRSAYRYTLELPGEQPDPLADFLFVRKEGHCEHFATALTVLLRSLGIPARVASGFYGGTRIGDVYGVRAGDAHAWTQVYVSGVGFQTLDATPESFREAAPPLFSAWAVEQLERLEALWRANVLDYSLRDQFRLADRVVNPPPVAVPSALRGFPLRRVLGVVLTLAGAWLLVRLLFLRGAARKHEATGLLEATERLLATASLRIREGGDLEELARRLSHSGHPLAPPVDRITQRYLQARFGSRPLREGEADALVGSLRRAVTQHTRPH